MHLVNGEAARQISILDRGLMYGQSVFETIAVVDREPLLLVNHMQRLAASCDYFSIPFNQQALLADIAQLCKEYSASQFVIRASQTMGEGGRGYKNPLHPSSNRIVSAFPFPNPEINLREQGILLGLVEFRLARQPALAGHKHGNRLEQLLARNEWQVAWHEALVRDTSDEVIEGSQANVFIVEQDHLRTPDLRHAGVAGVMRGAVIDAASKLGIECLVSAVTLDDVLAADEVFMCNSVIGIWPVKQFAQTQYHSFETSHKLLDYLIKNEAISPN